ncbi:MAG: glycoside hydrolase family 16 protein, partial [Gammaproteobacteria bacterium]|nr:glycoside hydrolase family 16 protein [Gammaproteobacteria bacterium]
MRFRSRKSLRYVLPLVAVFVVSACDSGNRPVPLSEVDIAPPLVVPPQNNVNIENPTLTVMNNFDVSPGDALTLVWSDEFDGAQLDPEVWFYETGDGSQYGIPGWGNGELQYYLPDSAQVSNGMLTITARQERVGDDQVGAFNYSSARINTRDRFAFKYGRIEASMRLPAGQGLWPAFWMLPQDSPYGGWAASGEIDIMEAVNLGGTGGNTVFGTIHHGGEFPANVFTGETYLVPTDATTDFHTYAVEWDATEIRWYVDDILYAVQNDWQSTAAPFPAPFDQPFYVLFNVAVGGNFPGAPDGTAVFPVTMDVDWVRVYSGEDPAAGGGDEPSVAAPMPTADPGNVISLFSDAYTDVAGIDYNPNWGQATVVTQEDIAGNNMLKYAGLDYQGTDFSGNAQDVSGMTSLHLDFWTADSTALNVYLISSDSAETAYALTVTPNTWVSVDIPLTAFAGVDLASVIQLKFDGNGTIFLDNLYFEADAAPATEPAVAAPTPTADSGNVISLFSDAYTDITPIDYNPNWGQATVVTQVPIAGNNTLKYEGLNYQGTDFSTIPQDVSAMTSFHLDFWTADSTALNVYLISTDAAETAYALTITPGTWASVDIPLTAFAGVDLASVMQLKFDGNGTIFLDNLYFEAAGAPATEPSVAAPTPTANPGNVISLFSDAYTDIAGIDYNPNWGQATVVTQVDIAGNNTLKYEGLNYQGTDFAGNPQDVSGLETFHLDFWTADSTALNVYLISTDTVEVAYALTITPNTWVSVDIPLTAFAGVDLANVMQLKFDGNGTIFLDNLYFEAAGAPATEPAAAAPTPTADPGDVISLFSDAYTDIAGIDYNPNWGQATVVTQVDIAGNNTLKYEGLDYQGTDFAGNPQDVSGLETFHLDFWTADSTALSVFLISTDTVEVEHVLTVTPGTWVSVDIPLTAFAGVDLASVMQLKFVGNGTIWLDNLYFTTGGGGGGGELVTDGGFEAAGSSGLGLQPPWFAFDSGGTVSVSNANN